MRQVWRASRCAASGTAAAALTAARAKIENNIVKAVSEGIEVYEA